MKSVKEIVDSEKYIYNQLKALKKERHRKDVQDYIYRQMHRNDSYSPWIEDNINKYYFGLPIKKVRKPDCVKYHWPISLG